MRLASAVLCIGSLGAVLIPAREGIIFLIIPPPIILLWNTFYFVLVSKKLRARILWPIAITFDLISWLLALVISVFSGPVFVRLDINEQLCARGSLFCQSDVVMVLKAWAASSILTNILVWVYLYFETGECRTDSNTASCIWLCLFGTLSTIAGRKLRNSRLQPTRHFRRWIRTYKLSVIIHIYVKLYNVPSLGDHFAENHAEVCLQTHTDNFDSKVHKAHEWAAIHSFATNPNRKNQQTPSWIRDGIFMDSSGWFANRKHLALKSRSIDLIVFF